MCITAECPDPTVVGIWWRDDASWKLYSKETMRAILQALLKGLPSLRLQLPIKNSSVPSTHSVTYLIDLSKMEQTNVASGHKRKIKLVLPPGIDYSGSDCKFFKDHEWRPHDSISGKTGIAPPVKGVARFRLHDSCILVIRSGNIAEWKVDGEVDAVVNPCGARRGSNRLADIRGVSVSRHSGADQPNVAAALHRAAGPKLQEALQKNVLIASGQDWCSDGVVTPGFNLPASHVVHTFAAPMYKKHDEASSCVKLEKTYKSALSLAALNGVQYLAFPAISCGASRFPVKLAARVAMQAICSSSSVDVVLEIHFLLLEQEILLEWMAQAKKIFSKLA